MAGLAPLGFACPSTPLAAKGICRNPPRRYSPCASPMSMLIFGMGAPKGNTNSRGKKLSAETRAKMQAAHVGVKLSLGHRAAIAVGMRRRAALNTVNKDTRHADE